MVRTREIRKRLNLDPSIALLVDPPYKAKLEVVQHFRPEEIERKARELLTKKEGAFDGPTWAVKNHEIQGDTLLVKIFPSSYFKFLATKELLKEDLNYYAPEIPLCIQGLVYAEIPRLFGRVERHYLFGLKTRGAIEGGTIAPVAGGFLDVPDLEATIEDELREESGTKINYQTLNTGFIKLNEVVQYSFCYDLVVESAEQLYDEVDGKSTKEFPKLRVIKDELIPEFLVNPNKFFPEVQGKLKTAPMTNEMLYLHLKAVHYKKPK